MFSQDIRKKFLIYFKEKGHAIVPSAPTVPHDDPTLLFINAGMNQFKDIFLGKAQRDYSRAVSSQKCIRVGGKHNDLDNVGHTSRHMTFFEMLGNFSFGDYFKKHAIDFAWEVSTEVFQFDPKRIWVSVFETDDEAFELWKAHIDESRIIRLGEEENFWSMGETGPCGPCSELLYDRGEAFGKGKSPLDDPSGERYPEFWNLVFMEYNRDQSGKLTPLPKPCVDTGAGLERVVSFLKETENVFQSDILMALIQEVEKRSGKVYDPQDPHLSPAFHVIADHIRALAFAIADGAQPSNTERGYVLRKILRRAVRYGRLLGFQKPFLADILPRLVQLMGEDYHELKTAEHQIGEILTLEEESFFRTLRRGGNILNTIIEKATASSGKEISGEDAFKLKDTYGFPLEEIVLIAKDNDLSVNLETFDLLDKEARARSRKAHTTHQQTLETTLFEDFVKHHGTSSFIGYEELEAEGTIKGLIVDGNLVDALEEGQEGMVILDQTPFYAEKGGQVGDHGTLQHKNVLFNVTDCQSPYPGIIAHLGTLKKGTLIVGEPLNAQVDPTRREKIAKHHTATHLLHWALQKVLGSHIRQAGSLVEPTRLRFDFNHHKGLTPEDIRTIEEEVNGQIWKNTPLDNYEIPLEEVQKDPDIKQFFGDKYGSIVRVVDIGKYSKELCGGTHIPNTGEIGYFRIAKEGSIAKGVRRIEAVIGQEAEKLRYALEDQMTQIASTLKASPSKVEEALQSVLTENQALKSEALAARKKHLSDLSTTLLSQVKEVNTIPLLSATADISKKELGDLGNTLMAQMKTGVLLLAATEEGRCQLLLKVSPDLIQRGIHAGNLIKEIAPLIEGSGGGKKESAQAGGKNPQGIPAALQKIEETLSSFSS